MAADDPERPPHWYIAGEPLYLHDPESGTMPCLAFAPGDRVPPDMAAEHGWLDKVLRPGTPAPDDAGPAPAPPPPPRPAPAAATKPPRSKEE
jgi:hypothetical protein